MKRCSAVLFLLGLAFLAWILWTTGPKQLWHQFRSLGWGVIPFILSEGFAEMVHTFGWRRCLAGPLRSTSWSFLFPARIAGYAINYLTPTAAMGGEATRAALLTTRAKGTQAVTGVLVGKVVFAISHVVFVLLGSIFLFAWGVKLPGPMWGGLLLSAGLVGGGIITFLFLQARGKLGTIVRWLAARKIGGHWIESAAKNITYVDHLLVGVYRERPRDLCLALCWHLLGYSFGIAPAWLFLKILTGKSAWDVASEIWFLGMWFDLLTFSVPMNVGTLEGSRMLVLKAAGYSTVLGVTYGTALRFAQLFWACFGLLCYALLIHWGARSPMVHNSKKMSGTVTKQFQTLRDC